MTGATSAAGPAGQNVHPEEPNGDHSDHSDLHERDQPIDPSFASIRHILLRPEQERIRQLEQQRESLQAQIQAMRAELEGLALREDEHVQSLLRALDELDERLQADGRALEARISDQIDQIIAARVADAPDEVAEAIGPVLAGAIRAQTRRSREELVESIGPVLGEAIQVQIRESRQGLVEALYPIIGETAQRFITETLRELQRTIDARLRSTFGPFGSLRRLFARLRGVSPSELTLRESLTFNVQEIFLIQPGSGLLMAHAGSSRPESDQIGGMLTAIRDFMRDSFGQSETFDELEEIQHGGRRIIIQNGRHAYLAVVITGIESTGFRGHLWRFVTQIHARHAGLLQAFDGDPQILEPIQRQVAQLAEELVQISQETAEGARPRPLSRDQKWLIGGGAASLFILTGAACFLSYFVWSAWPVVFAPATATPTMTLSPTATATATPTATPTTTPTTTPSATPTASPTVTPLPTATALPTTTPSPTPAILTIRPVWVRSSPNLEETPFTAIPPDVPVTVVAAFDWWLEVTWQGPDRLLRGWIPSMWVSNPGPIPPEIITPGAAVAPP